MKKTDALFISLFGLTLVAGPADLPAQTNPAPSNNPGAFSTDAGSISGILSVPANAGRVPETTITASPGGAVATTDAAGAYTLANLMPARYSLLFDSPGYARFKIENVLVQPGQATTIAPQTLTSLSSSNRLAGTAEQEITRLGEFVVNSQKLQAFVDHNTDLARTVDDVQPYYIFDAQTIHDSGAIDTEDFLRQNLSMDTNAKPNDYGAPNGALVQGGSSSINLRGLGTTQTLILIDGRRVPFGYYAGTYIQPDLNGIPLASIDRIEVLPSSASAIYGGSSVGGVVDVILKKDYTGGNLQMTYSNTMNTDTPNKRINGIYGFALEGGKTRVTLSGSWSQTRPILLQDRSFIFDYYRRLLNASPGLVYNNTTPFLGATPNIALYTGAYTGKSNTGYVYGPAFTNPNQTSLVLKNGESLNSPITHVPYGLASGDPNVGTALLANAGSYNLDFAPGNTTNGKLSQFGLQEDRKAFVASIQRQMTKDILFYVDMNTNSAHSTYNYTQWSSGSAFIIPGSAPGNPFNDNVKVYMPVVANSIGNVELINQNVAMGAVIKLPFDWTALADYSWTDVQKLYAGDNGALDGPTLGAYSNSVDADAASGVLSPFFDTIKYKPNIGKYDLPAMSGQVTTLNDLSLHLSGPLAFVEKFVGSTSLTFGLEHRKEGLKNGQTNPLSATPSPENKNTTIFLGQNQSTTSGYAELNSVLVDPKRNIPLLNSLSLQTAVRTELYTVNTGTATYTYADYPDVQTAAYGGPSSLFVPGYSTGGTAPIRTITKWTATKPMYGLKYKPVPEITFRVSYAQAFLPPTFGQLLTVPIAQSVATTPVTDPITGQIFNTRTIGGGNPATKPQTSNDWDAGVVFEPMSGWLKGLRASLEYYRIVEDNVITTYPNVQYIVNNVPSRVTRDSGGNITFVDNTVTNLLGLKTNGFDAQLNYITNTPIGSISIGVLGSIVEHLQKQTTVGQPFLEYDQFVFSGGVPKSKGSANLVWNRGNLRAGWTTTYVDSYSQLDSPGDPVYGPVANPTLNINYTRAAGSNRVPSQIYHNIFVAYTFGKTRMSQDKHSILDYLDSGTTLNVGVDDLFNTVPPFDPAYLPYYFSPFGPILLRTYQVSLNLPF
jgi:iron complex outermembrane receptor protein